MSDPANPQSDSGLYDLAPDLKAPLPASARKSIPMAAPAPLAYHSPRVVTDPKADPETIKNLYMPLWLLGGGVAIHVVAALFGRERFDRALMPLGFQIIVGTAIMLAGILIAARARGIDLGAFWTAVFKLAAVSVAPSAATALVAPLLNVVPIFGGLLGWLVEFVLYFALLGALFDLDESDTWYCVLVIFLVRLAVYFALLWAMPGRG